MGQEGDFYIMIEFAQKLADKSNPISTYVSAGHISLSLFIEVDEKKKCTAIEHNSTHYRRLFLPGDLEALALGSEGSEPIQLLKDRRYVMASQIEEFFVILSKDLWLRTIFICKDMIAPEGSHSLCPYYNLAIQCIQNNVESCPQHWEKLQDARKNYEADTTTRDTYLGTSDSKLEARFKNTGEVENTREKAILKEYEVCKLLKQTIGGTNSRADTTPFLQIEPDDVKELDELNNDLSGTGNVKKMLWRGRRFASKAFGKGQGFKELRVLQEIGTHPHIVDSFGVSLPEDGSLEYWMELMDKDLFVLIADLNRPLSIGETPMGSMDSMGILLQIAKAMDYLHEKNVVHGDLKPDNVLISHCEVRGDVRHYIGKLADFGSSRLIPSNDLETFELSLGTCAYAPPEFSNAKKIPVTASKAKKSEVYTFGLLAWEVLTGDTDFLEEMQKNAYREEIQHTAYLEKIRLKELQNTASLEEIQNTAYRKKIQDTLQVKRDFLVASLNKYSEIYHERLISLVIDRCLSIDPADRPSFAELTKELESIILEQTEITTTMRPKKKAKIHV